MKNESLKGGFEMLVISKIKPFYTGEVAGLIVEPDKGVQYRVFGLLHADRAERIPLSPTGTLQEAEKAVTEAQKLIEDNLLMGRPFLVHFSDQHKDMGISVEYLGMGGE